MMAPYRVLLADDHVMFRSGLRKILEETGRVKVLAEAGDGREVLDLLDRVEPEFVILDISMPQMSGLEVLSRIRKSKPSVKVLILSMHKDIDFLQKAISAGAAGYLVKEDTENEILAALEAISAGRTYVSPLFASELANDWARICRGERVPAEAEPLTSREKEVLTHIARGKSNKEIAALLFISIHTVIRHRANIMDKLQVKKAADLVRYAIQRGLA